MRQSEPGFNNVPPRDQNQWMAGNCPGNSLTAKRMLNDLSESGRAFATARIVDEHNQVLMPLTAMKQGAFVGRARTLIWHLCHNDSDASAGKIRERIEETHFKT